MVNSSLPERDGAAHSERPPRVKHLLLKKVPVGPSFADAPSWAVTRKYADDEFHIAGCDDREKDFERVLFAEGRTGHFPLAFDQQDASGMELF